MKTNVVLRIDDKADKTRIEALVSLVVGFPCTQLVARALWDVEKNFELTDFTAAHDATGLDLRGDFGHIFSKNAELRWRRVDADGYDVLILRDTPLTLAGTTALGAGWCIEEKRLQGKEELRTAHYRAPNGAVQFVSYREVMG